MLTLLIVLLIISAIFGGWGHGAEWGGPMSWSPLGIVIVILVILWFTGGFSGHHHYFR